MWARLAVLVAALASANAAADAHALANLRTRSDDLVTAISGTIGGHRLWFDLDTGATHSIVDAAVAKQLGLVTRGVGRLRGAGTGTVPISRLEPLTIRVGDVSFAPRDPIAVDLSHVGSAIEEGGLLGFDFYQRYVVDVDYDARRVRLYNPAHFTYRGNGTPVQLVLRPPRAYVSVLVAAKGLAPEKHLLRLDTGSSDAVDDDIILRSHAPKKTITGGVGIGGRFRAYLGTVTELQVGPYVLHNLPSATSGVQLIGDTVWRKFNIVFDFSRSVMYLSPRN